MEVPSRQERAGSLGVAAAVAVGLAILMVAIALSLRSGYAHREVDREPAAAPPSAPDSGRTQLSTSQTAAHWIDGLASGGIILSDVTGRLEEQDPKIARVVDGAWADLNATGSSTRLQQALSWVDGLVDGLIVPSDVTSRLRQQDPEMANIVMSVWADLQGR
jgi:hypothetical protein